jgi:hypothetical protein
MAPAAVEKCLYRAIRRRFASLFGLRYHDLIQPPCTPGMPALFTPSERKGRMTIQETIKHDLKEAMRTRDETRKDALRVILGELARQARKTLNDAETVAILKKLIKSEKELLAARGGGGESDFTRVVEGYLPRQATEEEIEAWIRTHVDFSRYGSKMQAMRDIMQHFGPRADGNMVKGILARF